jgi:predicted phosphodiesterase
VDDEDAAPTGHAPTPPSTDGDGTEVTEGTEDSEGTEGNGDGKTDAQPAPESTDSAIPADRPSGEREAVAGRDWAPWRRRARVIVFALAGAVIALGLAGRVSARVGPFDTTVAARPSWTGETVLRLAPLGTIGLDTHDWPLRLELRVDELGLDEAERIAERPELVDRLGDDLADEVRTALWHLAVRCTLVALVGGVAGALVARLSWRSALGGLGLGGLVVAGVGAGTAATFNAEAVAEPHYTGILTAAPTAVGDVEDLVDRFGEYRSQLSDLVGNIVTLYRAGENLPTFRPTSRMVRLLHVSDVHLNPTAFDLMRQITDEFAIDAVVDTGDITDWGTATEETIVDEIGRLDVPYVWVRGNHDSRSTQRAVARQPNATVLDGDAAEVAGLRIWGIGDPRYTPNKDELGDSESEQERADDFASVLAERLEEDEPPDADIVMTHDPRTAADLGGEVPLVLAGHGHNARERQLDDGTFMLVEGSTGGAGLRGLQGDEPEPLACSVLYFDPDTNRLVAYDRITVRGLGGAGATIDRHVVPEEDDEQDDGTSPTTTTSSTGTTTTTTTTR